MAHHDGALSRSVDRHRLNVEIRGFDLLPQGAAALGSVRAGEGAFARLGEKARFDPLLRSRAGGISCGGGAAIERSVGTLPVA
ncbi:MAG: hypothetical protein ABI639_16370, partial [Thermoanaerobaculia bacterium]